MGIAECKVDEVDDRITLIAAPKIQVETMTHERRKRNESVCNYAAVGPMRTRTNSASIWSTVWVGTGYRVNSRFFSVHCPKMYGKRGKINDASLTTHTPACPVSVRTTDHLLSGRPKWQTSLKMYSCNGNTRTRNAIGAHEPIFHQIEISIRYCAWNTKDDTFYYGDAFYMRA